MLKKLLPTLLFAAMATSTMAAEKYNATVNIDTEEKNLTGVMTLESDKKTDVTVKVVGFYNITIDGNPLRIKAGMVNVPIEKGNKKTIIFKKDLSQQDIITDDFISFSEIIPPIEGGSDVEYSISITLPKDFEAITSAESVKKISKMNKNEFVFTMSKPVESFGLIASTDYEVKTQQSGDVEIATYLFKKDADLAPKYMDYTAKYIKQYEELLGSKFPYKRFAVVEHKFPYGYATPGYTVLGATVIRLPFIPATSLGHEVLHQWFGSAITGKDNSNWFEAIATYFADMENLATIEEQNDYRKNIIASYENYIKDDQYPIKNFVYNDSKASQSVGYGKGAMVFHMLRMEIGSEKFYAGIKEFTNNYKYKKASWSDLFNSFQGVDLKDFADYWINKGGLPQINVSESMFTIEGAKPYIKFKLTRQDGPERMLIPYTVFYEEGKDEGVISTINGEQTISVPVKDLKARLVIDSDYDIMRKLSPLERPASLSGILASSKIIGVTGGEGNCDELFNAFNITDIKNYKELALVDFMENDLLICGFENPAIKTIAGSIEKDKRASSEYVVFKNPHTYGKYIMVARSPRAENINLLNHYGKYAVLKFNGRNNIEKNIDNTHNGIEVAVRKEDKATETRSTKTMDEVIKVAKLYPAIFIGERHDSYAHHMNQLEIIKKLHNSKVKIAVGFEQIQKQFQPVLDKFIKGEISELEFLNNTEYHSRWGFDYNLYAPIFRYLRDNKIPAVALNIDNSIIKKISAGKISDLTPEDIAQLPNDMKLSNAEYEQEIREVFGMHSVKSGADRSFNDFYFSQNVWDETMAESAVRFQKNNPDYKMVIIAGSGHMGKNSGIPLRYERLTGKTPFVILQDDELNPARSDVVFTTEPIYSKGTPKIGVALNMKGDRPIVESVDSGSPSDLAGIKAKDTLISCGGIEVGKNIGTLRYVLFDAGYGSEIKCSILREGKIIDKKITLITYEENDNMMQKMAEKMKEKAEKK